MGRLGICNHVVLSTIIIILNCVAYTTSQKLTLTANSNRVGKKSVVRLECHINKLQPGERVRWVKQSGAFTFNLGTELNLENTFIMSGRYAVQQWGETDGTHKSRLTIQSTQFEDSGTYGCLIEGSDYAGYQPISVCEDADSESCKCIEKEGWVTPICFQEPESAAQVHANYQRIVIGLIVCLVIAVIFGLVMSVMVARDCLSKTAAVQRKKIDEAIARNRQNGPEEKQTLEEAVDITHEDPSIMETYNRLQQQYHNGIVNSGFSEEHDYDKLGAAAAAAPSAPPKEYQVNPQTEQRYQPHTAHSRDVDVVVHRPPVRSGEIPESGRATPEGSLNLSERGYEPAVLNVTQLPGYSNERNPRVRNISKSSPPLQEKAAHDANNVFGSTRSLEMDQRNRSKDYTPAREGDASPVDIRVDSRKAYTDARPKTSGNARTAFAEPRKLDFNLKQDPRYRNLDDLGTAYVDKTDTMI